MPGRQPTPGETPLDDLSGLRVQGVTTKAALDALEAENVRRATLKYLASRPTRLQAKFDVEWLLARHAEMFGRVWKWAGTVRIAETNIGARPRDIQVELHELQRDLMAWEASGMALEEQAVRLHHRAVQIHPFPNGNGRWVRMLANIRPAVHDAAPIEWPDATIGSASAVRDEYLAAVQGVEASRADGQVDAAAAEGSAGAEVAGEEAAAEAGADDQGAGRGVAMEGRRGRGGPGWLPRWAGFVWDGMNDA